MEYTLYYMYKKMHEWNLNYLKENFITSDDIADLDYQQKEELNAEILAYIYDEIMNLYTSNYEEYSNIISLLVIHYYNTLCGLTEELKNKYENEELDEILKEINKCDKESFINSIDENDFLIEMLNLFIYEVDLNNDIEIYFSVYGVEYDYMDNVYKTDNGKKVYKEFHPNLSKELSNLYKYKKNTIAVETIENLKITSLFQYIYYFTSFKHMVEEKIVKEEFRNKLFNIKKYNKELFIEIYSYLIGYYYISAQNKQDNNKELNIIQKNILNNLKNNNLEEFFDNKNRWLSDYIIDEFINYEFTTYDELLSKSNNHVKEIVKKLTISN